MMNAVTEKPQSREVAEFLAAVLADAKLKQELKEAKDDAEFINIALRQATALRIPLTAAMLSAQMTEDRRIARFMSVEDVEAIADSLLGARLSGGHRSFMPPNC